MGLWFDIATYKDGLLIVKDYVQIYGYTQFAHIFDVTSLVNQATSSAKIYVYNAIYALELMGVEQKVFTGDECENWCYGNKDMSWHEQAQVFRWHLEKLFLCIQRNTDAYFLDESSIDYMNEHGPQYKGKLQITACTELNSAKMVYL